MIEIFENAVSAETADFIEKTVLSDDFSWYFNPTTIDYDALNKIHSDHECLVPFMFHTIISDGKINSKFWNQTSNLIREIQTNTNINIINIANIRLNLQFNQCPENKHCGIHTDNWENCNKTGLYYVNDSDGDTIFFDEHANIIKTVTPKKGKLIWFDSSHWHASTTPLKNKVRVVMNFNVLG